MLDGNQVILRLFQERDLDEFLGLYNRYEARGQYYPSSFLSPHTSRNELRERGWWEEHQGRMLITDLQDRMLGTVFFFKGAAHHEGYEIGYAVLRREDRGRGYMSEALPLFCAYLFEAKPIHRLYLHTASGNAASRKVAERAGFHHDGTLRGAFFMRGRFYDCEVYSLLRGEGVSLAECLGRSPQSAGDGGGLETPERS